MPPTARVPSPELISFFRRSLAIPLCSPRTLPCALRTTQRPLHHSPPTVLRRPPQCRALHLYQTARAKTTLGMHKILPFDRYQIPPPHKSDQKINLWTRPGGEQIAEGLSLEEVLENHIKPGHMLYLTQQMKKSHSENYEYLKENNVPNEFNNYAIIEQGKMPVKIAKQKKRSDQSPWVRDLAGLKEIHLNLASPIAYWQLVLCRAYAFLDNGHQVEFSIRFKGAFANKKERREPGPPEIWPWMHQHFPHLRPDFIRKGMPEGTYFMIEPFSDGKHMQFVLAMPHQTTQTDKLDQSFTDRVLMIKNRVSKSIKEGKQSELPKVLRSELITTGSDMYSLDSGRAKGAVPAENPYPRGSEVRWGDESFQPIPKSVQQAKTKEEAKSKARLKKQERSEQRGERDNLREARNMASKPWSLTPSKPSASWLSGSSSQRQIGLASDPSRYSWPSRDPGHVERNTREPSNDRWTLGVSERLEGGASDSSNEHILPSNNRYMVPRGKDRRRDEAVKQFGERRRRSWDTISLDR